MMNTTRRALSILFPEKCSSCGASVAPEQFLCDSCREGAHFILPPYCPCCGTSEVDCKCRKRGRAFELCVAPYYYEDSIRQAVMNLKFGGREDIAVPLGQAMSRTVGSRLYGVPFTHVTCVPSTRDKVAERGYNQAQSLGEQMVKGDCFYWLEQKPRTDWNMLVKKESEQMQHLLGADSRRRNIRDAYRLNRNRNIEDAVILLVDDIVTTGATASEIATILKLNGAKEVYVVSAALTRYKN